MPFRHGRSGQRPSSRPLLFLLVVALVATLTVSARDLNAAPAGVAAALEAHARAPTFDDEMAALPLADAASEARPHDFHSAFWASYLSTQLARLIQMDQGSGDRDALLARAQALLDRARASLPAGDRQALSSVHGLQSLIHQFRGWFAGDTAPDSEPARASRESLTAAIRTDSENPVVLVFVGTGLIGEGVREDRLDRILAGMELLRLARQRFTSDDRPIASTTGFNAEWIPMWLSRAETKLQESSHPNR